MKKLKFANLFVQMMDLLGAAQAPKYLMDEVVEAVLESKTLFTEELHILLQEIENNITVILSEYKTKPFKFQSRIKLARYHRKCLKQWVIDIEKHTSPEEE